MLTLGDVLKKIIGGGTPSKSKPEYWNGPIYWCSVKDMSDGKLKISQTEDTITQLGLDNSSANLIKAGNLITSTRMGLGRAFINLSDMAINQDLKALIPNDKTTTEFLLWLLLIKKEELEGLGTGSTVKGIRLETLRNIKINLPPLPTQRKIAKILSAYDDLIENNLKRIKLLEEMAQITYEEWFVSRKINKQLISDSQIELHNLEDLIANYMNGGWGKETEEGNYTIPAYVIRGTDMPDISSGSLDNLPLRYHTSSNFKSRELKYGDIIIEMSNGNIDNVGRSFYYDRDFNKLIQYPAICASFCKMLRPINIELSYIINTHIKYIYATNRMLVYKSQAANGINNFRFEDMISEEIISIPKGELLNKLVATLKPKYELISNIRNQIRLLKEARDILLPRLMTGMIDVENITGQTDSMMEDALMMAAENVIKYDKTKNK